MRTIKQHWLQLAAFTFSLALAGACSFSLAGTASDDDDDGGGGDDVCEILDEVDAECSGEFTDMEDCLDSDIESMDECDPEIDALIDCAYEVDDDVGECGEDMFDCMYDCEDDACYDGCNDGFDACMGSEDCEDGDDGGNGYDPCVMWDDVEMSCQNEFDAAETCDADPDPMACENAIDVIVDCIADVQPDIAGCGDDLSGCLDTCEGDACDVCFDDFDVCAGIEGCHDDQGPDQGPDVCAEWHDIEINCESDFMAMDTCTDGPTCQAAFDGALACINSYNTDFGACAEGMPSCIDACAGDMACEAGCDDAFAMCVGIDQCQEPPM